MFRLAMISMLAGLTTTAFAGGESTSLLTEAAQYSSEPEAMLAAACEQANVAGATSVEREFDGGLHLSCDFANGSLTHASSALRGPSGDYDLVLTHDGGSTHLLDGVPSGEVERERNLRALYAAADTGRLVATWVQVLDGAGRYFSNTTPTSARVIEDDGGVPGVAIQDCDCMDHCTGGHPKDTGEIGDICHDMCFEAGEL